MTAGTRRSELSPDQHARIKRHLTLIPLYVWTVFVWSVFVNQLPAMPGSDRSHLIRDFLHFYVQGAITRAHDAHALYDVDAMAAVADRLAPVAVGRQFPPVYPPQVGLLFVPLAWFEYETALYAWLGVSMVVTALCGWLVWRTRRAERLSGWTATVLLLGAPGLHFMFSFGQVSSIALVCFTALWLALSCGRPFAAGLAIGALAYKPQLGVVAAFVCVFGGEGRMVAGAAASLALQALLVLAYWGTGIVPAYAQALIRLPTVIDAMEPDKALMHSWRSLFLQVGLSSTTALAASLVLSAATVALAVSAWRTRGPIALRYAVLVLATVLVNPHVFGWDLLLLLPALFVTWDWSTSHANARVTGLTALVYAAPIVTVAIPAVPVQWSVPAMAGLSAVIWLHLRRDPRVGVDVGPRHQSHLAPHPDPTIVSPKHLTPRPGRR